MSKIDILVRSIRKNPEMYASAICARSAIIISDWPGKKKRAIEFIDYRAGDPRVNIQNDKGKAKAYQIQQVIRAIEKLEELTEPKK